MKENASGNLLIISSFIFIILLASSANALSDATAQYLIKQYSSFDIERPCIYNGSICSTAAVCNITISYAQGNGTVLYNNTKMTNQGSYHNLTLKPSDTFQPGWYQTFITCFDQDASGSEFFYYQVTSTGQENSTLFFIIIGLVCLAIICAGYLIRDEYVVFIGGAALLVLGIYTMIFGWGGIANNFSYMLAVIIVGLGVIFTIKPAYELIETSGETGYEEIVEEGY